jgi:hypothetical protein
MVKDVSAFTLAVTVCVGLVWAATSPVQATTVAELNAFPEDVHAAAVGLAAHSEVYRLRAQGREGLANCVLKHFGSIKGISDGINNFERAISDPKQSKEAAERILAQEIRKACFGKETTDSNDRNDKFLLVKSLFTQLSRDEDKVNILEVAINTQAAFDILNEEAERGRCILNKFLSGDSPGGFVELATTLHKQRESPDATVERDINEFITKHCGPDAYDNFAKTYDAATGVLSQKKQELDREIAEKDAQLAEMRRHAFRLPDGRSIFQSRKTGEWYFQDGTVVPEGLARKRVSPPPEGWPK